MFNSLLEFGPIPFIDLRSIVIARTKIRRDWRATSLLGRAFVRVGIAGIALLMVLTLGMLVSGIRPFGHVSLIRIRTAMELASTILLTASFGVVAMRTISRGGTVDLAALVHTTIPTNVTLQGLLLYHIAYVTVFVFGLPVAILTSVALIAGVPQLLLGTLLILVPSLLLSVIAGYTLGQLAVIVFGEPTDSVKALAGIVLVTIVLLAPIPGSDELEILYTSSLLTSAGRLFVSGAFVGTAVRSSSLVGLIVVVVGTTAAIPILYFTLHRLVRRSWLEDDSGRSRKPIRHFGRPSLFSGGPARASAWYLLLRTLRSPIRLVPVFNTFVLTSLPFFPLYRGLGSWWIFEFSPYVCGLAGVLVSGAAFGYNPIGDEGTAQPFVMTAGPEAVVRGRLLAGYIVGFPIAVAGPILAGLFLTGEPFIGTLVALFSGIGVVCAVPIVLCLGAMFPNFRTQTVFGGGEVTWPRRAVLVSFPILCVWWYILVSVTIFWPGIVAAVVGVNTRVVSVGAGLVLLATVGVSYGMYRCALRRVRTFRYS